MGDDKILEYASIDADYEDVIYKTLESAIFNSGKSPPILESVPKHILFGHTGHPIIGNTLPQDTDNAEESDAMEIFGDSDEGVPLKVDDPLNNRLPRLVEPPTKLTYRDIIEPVICDPYERCTISGEFMQKIYTQLRILLDESPEPLLGRYRSDTSFYVERYSVPGMSFYYAAVLQALADTLSHKAHYFNGIAPRVGTLVKDRFYRFCEITLVNGHNRTLGVFRVSVEPIGPAPLPAGVYTVIHNNANRIENIVGLALPILKYQFTPIFVPVEYSVAAIHDEVKTTLEGIKYSVN